MQVPEIAKPREGEPVIWQTEVENPGCADTLRILRQNYPGALTVHSVREKGKGEGWLVSLRHDGVVIKSGTTYILQLDFAAYVKSAETQAG